MRLSILKKEKTVLKRTILFLIFPFLVISLSSCLNDDNGVQPVEVPAAYVSLYQTSPDAPALDIFVSDRRINNKAFTYSDFNYTGYLRFLTGERPIRFTPNGANNTLLDTTVTFKENKFYSLFVVNEENGSNKLETIVLGDDIPENLDQEKALIRVVHLSPDATAVDVSKDEETVFENLSYKEASDFKEVPAGKTSFDFTFSDDEQEVTKVANYTLKSRGVYTIIVKGYANPPSGNTNKLSVQVVQN